MMETRPWPVANGTLTPVVQGIPYFLPKAVMQITIVSSRGASAASSAPTAGTMASPSIAPKASSTPAPTGSDKNAAAAKPTTLLSVSAENTIDPAATDQDSKTPQYTLTASAGVPSFVPDYQQKYYLRYMIDNNSDATLSLHTDANGLLSTANGEYVDQTAAEAATLAQIAAAAASFGGTTLLPADLFIQTTSPPKPPKTTCLLPIINRSLNFIPGEDDREVLGDVPQWRTTVTNNGTTTLTSVLESGRGQAVTITIQAALLNGATLFKLPKDLVPPTDDSPGVLFRDWQPWKIKITVSPTGNARDGCHIKESSSATVAMLPNGGAMFYLDVNREALIDKKVNLAVTNGMLTGVDISHPSPNLAALKLPLTILQPIVSLPFTAATSGSSQASGASSPQSMGGK